MTISQLEELFLKETGVVSPYKETTHAEVRGREGRARRLGISG
jgi:hypothetical protein